VEAKQDDDSDGACNGVDNCPGLFNAGQADEDAEFSMPYASGGGAVLAELLTIIGALLLLAGIWLTIRRHPRVPLQFAAGGAGFGLVLLVVTLGYLGTSATLLVILAVLAGIGVGVRTLVRALRKRREVKAAS
jgi:hypothetical protein